MSASNVIPFRQRANPRPQGVPAEIPSATKREEALEFDARAYLPEDRAITLRETSLGTHQIPHKVYEFMFKAAGTKVELLVFGCLIRFSMGYHRAHCKTSLSFISNWTGLAIPNARKGIETLLSKGLIIRKELGSHFDRPSLYEVPVVKGYLEYISKPPVTAKKEEKPPQEAKQQTEAPLSNQLQYCDQINNSTVIESITKKDILNINSKKTLSPEEFLKNYFLNLRPKKKRKTEWEYFCELKKDGYTIQEIADCLELLLEEGIPQAKSDLPVAKAECHSPMAFLASAIEKVLAIVPGRKEKIRKREERRVQEATAKEEKAAEEAEEEHLFAEKVRLFSVAFPTRKEKQRYIDDFARKNPAFAGDQFQARNFAISAWFDSRSENL